MGGAGERSFLEGPCWFPWALPAGSRNVSPASDQGSFLRPAHPAQPRAHRGDTVPSSNPTTGTALHQASVLPRSVKQRGHFGKLETGLAAPQRSPVPRRFPRGLRTSVRTETRTQAVTAASYIMKLSQPKWKHPDRRLRVGTTRPGPLAMECSSFSRDGPWSPDTCHSADRPGKPHGVKEASLKGPRPGGSRS